MKNKIVFTLWLVVLFVSFSVSADAANLNISVAASLTNSVKEIVALYEKAHPDVEIRPNFASSGSLARQITAGAPADIYISANPKWMQHLKEKQLIGDDADRLLVHNSLVFVGRAEDVKSPADLSGLKRIALGSPASTPVGRYAEQALTNFGIYEQLQAQRILVPTKDVRQALLYADRGEVDGAFVYQTDALLAKQAKTLFVVPQDLYPPVVYPAALTLAGEGREDAVGFFDFLYSSAAREVFRRYGFVVTD